MFCINYVNVGQMIREVREQRGFQQKDLANKIGVGKSAMSKIETGEQQVDIQTLVRISETLGVRLEYLLGIDKDVDDDAHIVNLFMKQFFRIITSQRFFGKKRVFTPEDFEDFFYAAKGQYVILEGPTRIFSLIKEVAKANGREKDVQHALIEEALKKYREEKDKEAKDKEAKDKEAKDKEAKGRYFLLSKNEMQNLIKEYAKWERARKELLI